MVQGSAFMMYNKTIGPYCAGKKFIIKIFFLFYFLKREVNYLAVCLSVAGLKQIFRKV